MLPCGCRIIAINVLYVMLSSKRDIFHHSVTITLTTWSGSDVVIRYCFVPCTLIVGVLAVTIHSPCLLRFAVMGVGRHSDWHAHSQ